MKKIWLLLALPLIISCQSIEDKDYKTSKFELRQMVQQTETVKNTSASYFFMIGSYSNSERSYTTVKVFAKVNGRYRLIEMPIGDIRIAINDSLSTPNIEIEYTSYYKKEDEHIFNHRYSITAYVINCPEKYLPEKLLPIGL